MSGTNTAILIAGPSGYTDDTTTYPPGATYGRIMLQPGANYTPPAGLVMIPDDGRAIP